PVGPYTAYAPRAGEHPQHNDPWMACTRRIESGGNYQAYNGSGPYYGAYQFTQGTWNSTANHAGRGELVGVDPRNASEYDQDDMAWTLYQWKGKAPWGGRC
ncbi:MAG: transglycosylase family protein, partial [Actinomycetota bacterium]|nr:transglycosylase family protein [Actinomycetota bacterium]